jgi:hypothetical protein
MACEDILLWCPSPIFVQLRRLHIYIRLDARWIDDWLNDPYKPLWERDIRRELYRYMPCMEEVVFEWEIEQPKDALEKTWADVVKE